MFLMRRVSITILAGFVLVGAGCAPSAPKEPTATTTAPTESTAGTTTPKPAQPSATATSTDTKPDAPSATSPSSDPDAVQKVDTVVGKGAAAAEGDLVLVTYTGRLRNGTEFDSNAGKDGRPFALVLGSGQVIKGWEEGLIGMKAGGERKLTIPYMKAYGEEGRPPTIPARADLLFDIKMLHVVKAGEESIYDRKDIKVGKGREVKSGDRVSVHYVGTLVNGFKFDSSRERGAPLEFTVGKGEMIPGFDAGVIGMRVGGRRELILPPGVGYGANPQSPVGANQVLKFDVELMKIQ